MWIWTQAAGPARARISQSATIAPVHGYAICREPPMDSGQVLLKRMALTTSRALFKRCSFLPLKVASVGIGMYQDHAHKHQVTSYQLRTFAMTLQMRIRPSKFTGIVSGSVSTMAHGHPCAMVLRATPQLQQLPRQHWHPLISQPTSQQMLLPLLQQTPRRHPQPTLPHSPLQLHPLWLLPTLSNIQKEWRKHWQSSFKSGRSRQN